MKKMIMMAAIVFATVAAQAVPVSWSAAGLLTATGATAGANGGKGFLFIIGQNGVTSVSQIVALVAAGSDISAYDAGNPGNTAANGLLSVTTAASGINIGWTSGTQTYSAFAIAFDATTQAAAGKYLLTQTGTISIGSASGSKAFAFGTQSANTWVSIVPEPTSMALLAIGGAVFGLRRKFRK